MCYGVWEAVKSRAKEQPHQQMMTPFTIREKGGEDKGSPVLVVTET